MYIISKFKDYYDGVAGSVGIDKGIVFERKQQTIHEDDKDMPNIFKRYGFKERIKTTNPFSHLDDCTTMGRMNIIKSEYDLITPFVIGFCGKYYVGWKLIKYGEFMEHNITITYDVNYINDLTNRNIWRTDHNFLDVYNVIINFDDTTVFRKFNTPVFVLEYDGPKRGSKRTLYVNAKLKDYEFYKIYDSFTAFQEIQMFIGGVLGSKENNMVDIDDKYKIEQHGFDKWSFRKEPTKKKK